jgi:hypothetical protein
LRKLMMYLYIIMLLKRLVTTAIYTRIENEICCRIIGVWFGFVNGFVGRLELAAISNSSSCIYTLYKSFNLLVH